MKRVTRISEGAPLRITFNAVGRALEWQNASEGGTPQDVPDAVAHAIASDPSLAPHFRIESVEAEQPSAATARTEAPAVAPRPKAASPPAMPTRKPAK